MSHIVDLVSRLHSLSEDTEDAFMDTDYMDEIESEDEKLSLFLKKRQGKDILINDDLLLHIEYQKDDLYVVSVYSSKNDGILLDNFSIKLDEYNIMEELD